MLSTWLFVPELLVVYPLELEPLFEPELALEPELEVLWLLISGAGLESDLI